MYTLIFAFLLLLFTVPARAGSLTDFASGITGPLIEEISGNADFGDFVSRVMEGESPVDSGFVQSVLESVLGDIHMVPGDILSLMGFVILSSCVKGAQIRLGDSVSQVAYLVCYFVVSTFLISILHMSVEVAMEAADEIEAFIRMSLPAYIGIVTTTGINASHSRGIFLFMVNVVSGYAGDFMINAFFFIGILTIVGNLSSHIRITKLIVIARQILFWVLGFLLTVFAGLTTLSGLAVSTSSATGIRAAKYTIGHAIPVVGGFLADSTELILASAKIFKNAFGTAGITALFLYCLIPVAKLFVVGFLLKLTAGLTEPFCDKLMSESIYGVGQTVIHIMVSVLLMTVMFILAFAVLMNL